MRNGNPTPQQQQRQQQYHVVSPHTCNSRCLTPHEKATLFSQRTTGNVHDNKHRRQHVTQNAASGKNPHLFKPTWRALNILEYTFVIGVSYHEDTNEDTDFISNKSTFTLNIHENAM